MLKLKLISFKFEGVREVVPAAAGVLASMEGQEAEVVVAGLRKAGVPVARVLLKRMVEGGKTEYLNKMISFWQTNPFEGLKFIIAKIGLLRAAFRNGNYPDARSYNLGFRAARPAR